MKTQLVGDLDSPLLEVSLSQGEQVRLERGAMVYMQDVELNARMNTSKKGFGGLLSAVGRAMSSGEDMWVSTATSFSDNGIIGLAPPVAGKIMELELDNYNQYRLNTSAFLASEMSVNYEMKRQSLGKAIWGRSGGLFVMETIGTGSMFISSFGDIIEMEVTPDRPLTIDNGHVVAWDKNLDYDLSLAGGFGVLTGEGVVNTFHGSGKVYIQTRTIDALASSLIPFMPTSSSN